MQNRVVLTTIALLVNVLSGCYLVRDRKSAISQDLVVLRDPGKFFQSSLDGYFVRLAEDRSQLPCRVGIQVLTVFTQGKPEEARIPVAIGTVGRLNSNEIFSIGARECEAARSRAEQSLRAQMKARGLLTDQESSPFPFGFFCHGENHKSRYAPLTLLQEGIPVTDQLDMTTSTSSAVTDAVIHGAFFKRQFDDFCHPRQYQWAPGVVGTLNFAAGQPVNIFTAAPRSAGSPSQTPEPIWLSTQFAGGTEREPEARLNLATLDEARPAVLGQPSSRSPQSDADAWPQIPGQAAPQAGQSARKAETEPPDLGFVEAALQRDLFKFFDSEFAPQTLVISEAALDLRAAFSPPGHMSTNFEIPSSGLRGLILERLKAEQIDINAITTLVINFGPDTLVKDLSWLVTEGPGGDGPKVIFPRVTDVIVKGGLGILNLDALARFPSLTRLYLNGAQNICNASFNDLSFLYELSDRLESLGIVNCGLTNLYDHSLFSKDRQLSALKALDLSGNTGLQSLASIFRMPLLEQLIVDRTSVDKDLIKFAAHAKLRLLSAQRSAVSVDTLKAFFAAVSGLPQPSPLLKLYVGKDENGGAAQGSADLCAAAGAPSESPCTTELRTPTWLEFFGGSDADRAAQWQALFPRNF